MGLRVVAVLLLVVGLAGCSTTSRARYIAKAEATPSSTPAASATGLPSSLAAKDGTDITACTDGDCEIAVTGTVEIALEPRFGFSSFRITWISPNIVEFAGTDVDGGTFQGSVAGAGQVGTETVGMLVRTVRGKGGIVRMFPT